MDHFVDPRKNAAKAAASLIKPLVESTLPEGAIATGGSGKHVAAIVAKPAEDVAKAVAAAKAEAVAAKTEAAAAKAEAAAAKAEAAAAVAKAIAEVEEKAKAAARKKTRVIHLLKRVIKKQQTKLGAHATWTVAEIERATKATERATTEEMAVEQATYNTMLQHEAKFRNDVMDAFVPRLERLLAVCQQVGQDGRYFDERTLTRGVSEAHNLFLKSTTTLDERMTLTISNEGYAMGYNMSPTQARVTGYLLWKNNTPNAGKHPQYVEGRRCDVISYWPEQRQAVRAVITQVMTGAHKLPPRWWQESADQY